MAEILNAPNPRKGIFFVHALTLLGLFCFWVLSEMTVLRRGVAHSTGMAKGSFREMIVLRRVIAHRVKPNNVRAWRDFSYNAPFKIKDLHVL
jgi:hypothetical protein